MKTLLPAFILLLSQWATAQVWNQKGNDIDGEAAFDRSGISIGMSANGNMLAVGAYFNDDAGQDAGHVRVYHWNGAGWIQQGADIDGEAAGDRSGWSVSLSDDGFTVAIGAYLNAGNGTDAGHVRVYEWNGNAWVQKGTDINGEAAGDYTGWSVDLSADGNTMVVGAPLNGGIGPTAGHVRIFEWNGNAWAQKGNDIDGEAAGDWSGYAVAISADGNTVAIGAGKNDANGMSAGHARVFEWNGNAWIQKGIDMDGEAAEDEFGFSIALSEDGNTVAVGSTKNDDAGNNAGHVRVFAWNGAAWTQQGNDLDGEAADDLSGKSIDLAANGNVVAIGATSNDGGGIESGHVRIYSWDGAVWTQMATDIEGETTDDQSGWSVKMDTSATTVAIGAIVNDGSAVDAGHVRVFATCAFPVDTLTQTICFGDSLVVNGTVYDITTIGAVELFQNVDTNGCDSAVVINLTVEPEIDLTVTTALPNLIATNQAGTTFQWLYCDSSYAPIPGQTVQGFFVPADGNYAVEVTLNGCVDTSDCVSVIGLGVMEYMHHQLTAYPNPTHGEFAVLLQQPAAEAITTVRNIAGQVVATHQFNNTQQLQLSIDGAPGFYWVEVLADEQRMLVKILKE